jgi:hypothetical protein
MKRLPQIALLPDGKRLHLQDGPIDLIIEAKGNEADVRAAYEAAARRFTGLLDELCEELTTLRQAADPAQCALKGVVARRMHAAVAPFAADRTNKISLPSGEIRPSQAPSVPGNKWTFAYSSNRLNDVTVDVVEGNDHKITYSYFSGGDNDGKIQYIKVYKTTTTTSANLIGQMEYVYHDSSSDSVAARVKSRRFIPWRPSL